MASRLAPKKLANLPALHNLLPLTAPVSSGRLPFRRLATAAARAPDPDDVQIEVAPQSGGRSPYLRGPTSLLNELFNPFQSGTSLLQMMNNMDRLFDDPFFRPSLNLQARRSNLRTPWDAMEDEKAFRLRMDMPGLSKEQVKVSVEEGVLVIQGEHVPPSEGEAEDWSSRGYRSYNSRILLPDNVRTDHIKAEMKNGVLFVTAPKAEMKKEATNVHVH